MDRPKSLADFLGPGYKKKYSLPPYKELNPNVNLLYPPDAAQGDLPPADAILVDERLAAAFNATNEVPN
jgi:hypothetical protein